jgi:DNA-binding NarL/FixJ family response regulator
VLVVDDHPAVRAGVAALVDAEPGLHTVEAVGDAFAVAPAVHAHRPDVVVLDYQLPGIDGLSLCRTLRSAPLPPAVLIYSAFASRDMIVPAHIAGAGALADKALEPRELTLMIRRLADGERLMESPTPDLLDAAGHRLPRQDLPLLGMLTNGVAASEIAEVLGLSVERAHARIDRLLARLVVAHQPL